MQTYTLGFLSTSHSKFLQLHIPNMVKSLMEFSQPMFYVVGHSFSAVGGSCAPGTANVVFCHCNPPRTVAVV